MQGTPLIRTDLPVVRTLAPAVVIPRHHRSDAAAMELGCRRCHRWWPLRPGDQVPASCPGCGKFDW